MAINNKSKLLTDDGEMLDDYSHLTGWIRNPYTKNVHRERTFLLDEEIIKCFDILAEKKGIYRDEFITQILKDYLIYAGVEGVNYDNKSQG
jgi:hypothetical protein